MEENMSNINCSAVGRALEDLVAAVRFNATLPPECRNNVITLVKDPKRPEMIMVNGSVQNLRLLLVDLFKARPELRSVVQSVLNDMYMVVSR